MSKTFKIKEELAQKILVLLYELPAKNSLELILELKQIEELKEEAK